MPYLPLHPPDFESDVSRETLDRLGVFVDLLLRWNRRVNLLAPNDVPHAWKRHVADSLQLIASIPPASTLALDLGSGAGFPGLVLCIATGMPFFLAEADRRKAAFLREAARVTAAPATVLSQRAESLTCKVDLVTARALAPLSQLLDWASPRLLPGGACLFHKGRYAAAEIAEAERRWRMTARTIPSVTAPDAAIVLITGIEPR